MNSPDDCNPEIWFWVYSATGKRLGYGAFNLPGEVEVYIPEGDEEGYVGAVVQCEIELSSGVKIGRATGDRVYDDEGSLVGIVRGENVVSPDGELLATVPGNISNEARGGAAMLLAGIRWHR